MTRVLIGLLVCGIRVGRLSGQAPVEAGLAIVAVASDPAFGGAGPSLRIGLAREVAVHLLAAGGRRGDRWVGRGELTIQYRFIGARPRRPAWYLAGGLAGVTGRAGGSYLSAGLGYEVPIGRRTGWWAEVGAGGGARLVAGFRSRLGK